MKEQSMIALSSKISQATFRPGQTCWSL